MDLVSEFRLPPAPKQDPSDYQVTPVEYLFPVSELGMAKSC